MTASCGACNLCCKLLGVPDINKPSQMLCWWTGLHGGCSRQSEKTGPDADPSLAACAQFECVWLASQKSEGFLPRYLRPDICHVVLGPQDPKQDQLLYVQVDPKYATAWREEGVLEYLSGASARGWRIEIIIDEVRIEFAAGALSMPLAEPSSGIL